MRQSEGELQSNSRPTKAPPTFPETPQLMLQLGPQVVVALGRALPAGIGSVVGGGGNYGNTRLLGHYANKFFTELPYRTIDTTTDESSL